jgi:hypothetical protein
MRDLEGGVQHLTLKKHRNKEDCKNDQYSNCLDPPHPFLPLFFLQKLLPVLFCGSWRADRPYGVLTQFVPVILFLVFKYFLSVTP